MHTFRSAVIPRQNLAGDLCVLYALSLSNFDWHVLSVVSRVVRTLGRC